MPPKRKRGESQPETQRPEASRRSSRRIKESNENGNAPTDGKRSASPIGSKSQKNEKSVFDSKEGVQEVVKELSQMEKKLQNNLKRQRLAVETSDLGVDTQEPADRPFQPRLAKASKGFINEQPADMPDEVEKAPVDGHEADLAQGDVADAKIEEDKLDRGAKRPPPVHSAILPLPWKGRLGYVGCQSSSTGRDRKPLPELTLC